MYAAIQAHVESLRSKALNNDYTKVVVDRLDAYKSRVTQLRDVAVQRRDAAVQFVKQYQDLMHDIVHEQREAVTTKAKQAKAQVGDYLDAQCTLGQQTVESVRTGLSEKREKVRTVASEKAAKLTSSLTVVADVALSYTVGVLAVAASLALRVNVAARDAAPPSALETVDKRVEQVKPYVLRAAAGVQAVDARLGGYGNAVVQRVATGVSEKLQAQEPQQKQPEPAAE